MLESSVEFLICIRCDSKLELEIFRCNKEIEEGFLECSNCKLLFPIIDKIPILWVFSF
jgi:uncharacterized protein YbaR (Trm112 family)